MKHKKMVIDITATAIKMIGLGNGSGTEDWTINLLEETKAGQKFEAAVSSEINRLMELVKKGE